ncbi:hypothetical protein E0Z10_g808 [Xylaria hypoxylon]|uniref:RBR-type E3 ubiquitin transferase n=1 Tax=Xylaria hypoxylon TaxID=37992 RepID=A0A4Z0Z806_9PEZI|nr:hypothetical protein E0Z10_g808 [Xylaria hypoxylon]
MDEDPRDIELSTITAIYPELQLDENDPHRLSIELPVSLSKPLTVLFPAVTGVPPSLAPSQTAPLATAVAAVADSQALSNLPALQVDITLPDGYPQDKPPNVSISTSPPWLSNDILRKLETDVIRLWEDIGRDQVIFTYVDDLQRSSDDVFGLVDSKGTLEVAPDHKIALLDYDINAKRKAFEKETFECGICLYPKKGSVCHKMLDCGHVFCIQCLQDFYNNAITEGDVAAVTCLTPNCARERGKNAIEESSPKRRKPRTFISPSELLQIPLEHDMVKRYVTLKHKTKLESDKNTIYCPRSWCQGAARSKKHKKPDGFELADSDDEEDEDTGLLAICEDCGFAFCSRCGQGWHGEFNYCIPKERKDAITEEEKASLEYLKLHSTPCPTCAAPYPSNPYKHFNTQPSGEGNSCYMRLWELEGGDGDDVGIGYGGGDAIRNANDPPGQYGDHLEIIQRPGAAQQGPGGLRNEAQVAPVPHEAPEGPRPAQPQQPRPGRRVDVAREGPRPAQPQQPHPERRAIVAREGPLVLRIEGGAPVIRDRGERGPHDAGAANPRAPPIANPRANGFRRGGRGGNRPGRGGAGANQHNDRNRAQGAARANNNGARMHQAQADHNDPQNPDLNPQQEAWIRQFVQLALNDEEHLVEWDSDDE